MLLLLLRGVLILLHVLVPDRIVGARGRELLIATPVRGGRLRAVTRRRWCAVAPARLWLIASAVAPARLWLIASAWGLWSAIVRAARVTGGMVEKTARPGAAHSETAGPLGALHGGFSKFTFFSYCVWGLSHGDGGRIFRLSFFIYSSHRNKLDHVGCWQIGMSAICNTCGGSLDELALV